MRIRTAIAATLLMIAGAPAGAQMQSDSYKFLKAVRDQDALKAKELFDRPGSTIVNSRDYSTGRSEEHTSELQSLMRISYAVFCLKKKNNKTTMHTNHK